MVIPNMEIKFSYEDYINLPESETKRYELLEGELVMVPSPNVNHQTVSINLEFIILQFVKQNKLGAVFHAPMDVVLSLDNVVQPDILFISNEQSNIITEKNINGTPDLVIEILSPSTSGRDVTVKHTLYSRYGVKEYWIVDPVGKNIEVHALQKQGLKLLKKYESADLLESPMLKGITIPLSEIFS